MIALFIGLLAGAVRLVISAAVVLGLLFVGLFAGVALAAGTTTSYEGAV